MGTEQSASTYLGGALKDHFLQQLKKLLYFKTTKSAELCVLSSSYQHINIVDKFSTVTV